MEPQNNLELQRILDAFQKHPNDIYAVAHELGIPPSQLMRRIHKLEHRTERGVSYIVPLRAVPRDLGPESLRPYIISVRHVDDLGWPITTRDAIETARAQYDLGLVDMFQRKTRGWVIQYARRRRVRDYKRRAWFSLQSISMT